jgi:hypothetical protein
MLSSRNPRHGLRRLTTGSALPKFLQSVPRGLRHFVASLVRFRYGLPGLRQGTESYLVTVGLGVTVAGP